ncbi:MAG: DUF429 domain-containing protein [Armatimonadetes bacterium]|nr:DUF429 domain-containing protein [Armatimonadota bacterium]
MHSSTITYVGIDLAWSAHNETGIAIWGDQLDVEVGVFSVPEIVDRLLSLDGRVVAAIDAPLISEPGRMAERELQRVYGKHKASCHCGSCELLVSTGRDAGMRLGVALQEAGFSLDPVKPSDKWALEVYPHAAMVAMWNLPYRLEYKAKPRRTRETRTSAFRRLQELLKGDLGGVDCGERNWLDVDLEPLRGKALKRLEDGLDAITCAVVARKAHPDRLDVFGNVETGYIVVPKREENSN